jgi:hypothetical protein
MKFEWFDGFKIEVILSNNAVLIKANVEGIKPLVNCLTALSESKAHGAHIHLDEFNSLEPGSIEVVFEKVDE